MSDGPFGRKRATYAAVVRQLRLESCQKALMHPVRAIVGRSRRPCRPAPLVRTLDCTWRINTGREALGKIDELVAVHRLGTAVVNDESDRRRVDAPVRCAALVGPSTSQNGSRIHAESDSRANGVDLSIAPPNVYLFLFVVRQASVVDSRLDLALAGRTKTLGDGARVLCGSHSAPYRGTTPRYSPFERAYRRCLVCPDGV